MRRSYLVTMTSAVVLVATALAACSVRGPALASSPEDIAGIWYAQRDGLYVQFLEDGTYRTASNVEDLEIEPWMVGEYSFEGTRLSVEETFAHEYVLPCEPPMGVYEVRLLENGSLKFDVVEEDCALRREAFAGQIDTQTGERKRELDPVSGL